ncbi:MAG: PDR/VanB family oxidoreductase [Pseudomonadota bacterium]
MSTYPEPEPGFLKLKVTQKQLLAGGIYFFELRQPDGSELPVFTPGAHLTVQTPSGVRRNYSICSKPADRNFYQIAVKRDAGGRGGSISMADDVHAGELLAVSAPRNNFELHPRATRFLFVAGGIGITPILAMMRHLKTQGNHDFKLIYCTRDAASTAFLDILGSAEFAAHVQIHHDKGDINQAFDFWPVLESPTSAHVYCCGPRGLMDAVADMSGHWPQSAIHFESFGVDAGTYAANTAFTVRLQKSGEKLVVGAGQSILQALRASGHHVSSSCESGTCGSCRTGLLSGEAEHRDMVLSDDEKAGNIMVCVSRAKSAEPTAELVLDL